MGRVVDFIFHFNMQRTSTVSLLKSLIYLNYLDLKRLKKGETYDYLHIKEGTKPMYVWINSNSMNYIHDELMVSSLRLNFFYIIVTSFLISSDIGFWLNIYAWLYKEFEYTLKLYFWVLKRITYSKIPQRWIWVLSWKYVWPFIWVKLNPLYLKMLRAIMLSLRGLI